MTAFRIERRCPLPPDEAWRRVTDWPRHTGRLPLTQVTATPPGPTRPGTWVVARTGLGRLAFDDPMEVVHWEPPRSGRAGRCRLVKRGTRITGWAEIEVRAEPGGARVIWHEDARVRRLPRLFDAPTARAARLVFGRLLTGLLA